MSGFSFFFAGPLRESALETIPQYLATSYGEVAAPIASVFTSIGIFLNIIAQLLAAISLLTSMFPLTPAVAALIAITLIVFNVLFGGFMATGIVGIVKMALLYLTLLITGVVVYGNMGGISGLHSSLPAFPWFSLFGRGFSSDAAAGLSLLIGVLSTQTYILAVFSGKDVKASRKGALWAGLIIPPCGIVGVWVGMYMRIRFPGLDAAEAFPMFVINFLPPWLGGAVLATLLVAVIGAAGGLSLGISTMLAKDIYKRFIRPEAQDRQVLRVTRRLLIAVLLLSLVFVSGSLRLMILQWSFLSMGLRGATVFFPLVGAIFFKNYVKPMAGILSLVAGPLADLIWKLLNPGGTDPLYAGLFVSLIVLVLGSWVFRPRLTPEYPSCRSAEK